MNDRFKVFDQMLQAVSLVDVRTDYVVRTNESFAKMVGRAREDFGPLTLADIVEPADLSGSREALVQLGAGAIPSLETAWHYLRTDGTLVSSRTMLVLLNGSPGFDACFVMVIEDLTQRDALEDRLLLSSLVNGAIIEGSTHYRTVMDDLVRIRTVDLERARDDAESASRAKSAFLGTVSHELRTPLNAIIGFSSLLLENEGVGDLAEQRKQLAIIRDSGQQLLELIRDILDIASIEAGRLGVKLCRVDLCPIIDKQVQHAQAEAGARHLKLKVSVCDPSIIVQADALRVGQVLRNLLSNGIKFTDHGHVAVSVTVEGGFSRIEVEDTGIGIRADRRKELFVPFQRIHEEGQAIRPGTGLGLAISRRLVEAMHGQIGVESVAGGGSRFWFSVPMAAALSPEIAPDRGANALAPSGSSARSTLRASQSSSTATLPAPRCTPSLLRRNRMSSAVDANSTLRR